MTIDLLRLNRPLSSDTSADPDDLVNVKHTLNHVGLYPEDNFYPITDDNLFRGVRMFQATNGLDIDGRMMPDGPTEGRLNVAQAEPSPEQRARQLPIPAYRADDEITKDDWQAMHDAVDRTGLGSGQRRAFMEIFAAEGGIKADTHDAAVVAGLSPARVLELSQVVKEVGLPERTHPRDLTAGERVAFYWTWFRSRDHSGFQRELGDNVLDRIGDDEVAASIADVVFRRGGAGKKRDGGVEIVQQAVNNLTSSDLVVDGRFGPKSFEAVQTLAADPVQRRRLLDEIADVRIDKLKPKSANFAGERRRAEYFRFRGS